MCKLNIHWRKQLEAQQRFQVSTTSIALYWNCEVCWILWSFKFSKNNRRQNWTGRSRSARLNCQHGQNNRIIYRVASKYKAYKTKITYTTAYMNKEEGDRGEMDGKKFPVWNIRELEFCMMTRQCQVYMPMSQHSFITSELTSAAFSFWLGEDMDPLIFKFPVCCWSWCSWCCWNWCCCFCKWIWSCWNCCVVKWVCIAWLFE